MKRSMAMLSVLCSLSVFAKDHDKKGPGRAEYTGTGIVVNTTDGGAQTAYHANVVVKWDENGTKTIFSRVETDKDVMNYQKTIVPGEFNTYTINNKDGQSIGSGYCVEKNFGTICHSDITIENKTLEETVHLSRHTIDRMGSVRDESGRKYWHDTLHKVK